MTAREFADAVAAVAAAGRVVRKRLTIPAGDTVDPIERGQQYLSPADRVARVAAEASILILDGWPTGIDGPAAIVEAARRAAGDDPRPVTRLHDPRLLLWLADHLPPPAVAA